MSRYLGMRLSWFMSNVHERNSVYNSIARTDEEPEQEEK